MAESSLAVLTASFVFGRLPAVLGPTHRVGIHPAVPTHAPLVLHKPKLLPPTFCPSYFGSESEQTATPAERNCLSCAILELAKLRTIMVIFMLGVLRAKREREHLSITWMPRERFYFRNGMSACVQE